MINIAISFLTEKEERRVERRKEEIRKWKYLHIKQSPS
jgi:hypothetical protein